MLGQLGDLLLHLGCPYQQSVARLTKITAGWLGSTANEVSLEMALGGLVLAAGLFWLGGWMICTGLVVL